MCDNEREPAVDDLERLRHRIDDIDERLVDLLAERRRTVDEVVACKRARRLPVYHPAREEDLLSRRRRQAAVQGLDPDFLEELFRLILRQSRRTQSRRLTAEGILPGGRVLLVGGGGGMGTFLRRLFAAAGYEVRVLETGDWEHAGELGAGIDAAIVAVPIGRTEEVIRRLAPLLPEKAVLADITSIKERPVAAMLAAHGGPVVGLHPLFGPGLASMDKQVVAVTPGRDDEGCRWLLDQIAAWGAILMTTTPAEHDRLMAVVQGLRHFATFAFGRFLWRRGVDISRTLEFSSPIYRLELGMVGRLFAQDPELYADIILADDERRRMLGEYADAVREAAETLVAGDGDAFRREFREIAEWFGAFSEQALRESGYLIDKLIERF
ncbi:MAG: bifunctional chorismate mutase/prephenate dehydrogenase [Deltaproteobacteria bacterium]|nr:bifunctional chorismate mutase/prephenate dehydrogenase [Candidatus Anaeroferrophillacea bacterium]